MLAATIGYTLAGLTGVRIVFAGARFLVAPRAAAAGFGITATPGDRNAGATACGVHGATAAVPLVTAAG